MRDVLVFLRRNRLHLILSTVLLLGLAACDEAPTPAPPAPPEVVVQIVATQNVAMRSELPGRATAFQSSEVRPQVNGLVKKRLFVEGADVEEGELLYLIDPAPYQAAVEQARGQLTSAQSTVASAAPKAARYRNLVDMDAMSRQEGDDAQASLGEAQAAVAAAQAALRAAQIDLDNTQVKAPIAGRIGTSNYTAGALVSASQVDALATINQLDPLYIDILQSSSQVLSLRRRLLAGQLATVDGKAAVTVILEDGSTYEHAGTLEVIDAAVSESTGSVKLRAQVPNPDHLILPGMYVKAALTMATDANGILVPQKAVARNSKGQATVMVVAADGTVEQRVLATGAAVGDQWIVLDGLKAGEVIVVEGVSRARPGKKVHAVSAASAVPDAATPVAPSQTD